MDTYSLRRTVPFFFCGLFCGRLSVWCLEFTIPRFGHIFGGIEPFTALTISPIQLMFQRFLPSFNLLWSEASHL